LIEEVPSKHIEMVLEDGCPWLFGRLQIVVAVELGDAIAESSYRLSREN
jgi:hypothetical protein